MSILPGAGKIPAPQAGFGERDSHDARNAISQDGSRIVWYSEGNLYLRDTAKGETLQLAEPHKTPQGAEQVHFQTANSEDVQDIFHEGGLASESL